MGIKERKLREKEILRQLILSHAEQILMKDGLDGLTMRAIGNHIEYSQSKIYEFFKNKDELCEALCKINCEKQLAFLETLPKSINPEQHLSNLVVKSMEFHRLHKHSDSLLTYVCFGPGRFELPEEFLKVEKLFVEALINLKSPHIVTENDVLASLDIIRCIFIGVSTLMNTTDGKPRAQNITKNILDVLLRGWKK